MKSFPLYTVRATTLINEGDSPSLIEAKRKQEIINSCVEYLKNGADINPPKSITYARIGRATRNFEIDGVAVKAGEIIRYNVN